MIFMLSGSLVQDLAANSEINIKTHVDYTIYQLVSLRLDKTEVEKII